MPKLDSRQQAPAEAASSDTIYKAYFSGSTKARKRLRAALDSPPAEKQHDVDVNSAQSQNPTITYTFFGAYEPIPTTGWRYKEWRRRGSPHNTLCYECYQPDDIGPCDTCTRVYHESCKPTGSYSSIEHDTRRWYCAICVWRGWHLNPPIITPLASLMLTSGDIDHTSRAPQSRSIRSTAEAVQHDKESRGQNGQFATHPHLGQGRTPQPGSIQEHIQTPHTAPAAVERANKQTQRMTTPKIPSTTSAPRKSQFNTLPQEVDSALSVVYRELEGVLLLRKKISDLESELARVHQESNIQRNELALSRRVVERVRLAEDELQRLRAEAAKRQAYTKEITILKAKNQELESEVTDLRSELEKSSTALQEWKQKLSTMLGD